MNGTNNNGNNALAIGAAGGGAATDADHEYDEKRLCSGRSSLDRTSLFLMCSLRNVIQRSVVSVADTFESPVGVLVSSQIP